MYFFNSDLIKFLFKMKYRFDEFIKYENTVEFVCFN